MFCGRCGEPLDNGDMVCKKCNAVNRIANENGYVQKSEEDSVYDKTVYTEKNTDYYREQEIAINNNSDSKNRSNTRKLKNEKNLSQFENKQQSGRKTETYLHESDLKEKKRHTRKSYKPLKKWKIAVSVLAAIIFVGAIVFMFPYIRNTFAKLFMSPEDYFAYVVKNNSEDSAEKLAIAFENMKNASSENSEISGKATITIVENTELFFNTVMNVEKDSLLSNVMSFDWVENIVLDCEYSSYKNRTQTEVDLKINDEPFTTLKTVSDSESGNSYFGMPEFNESYFLTRGSDEKSELEDMKNQFIEALPEEEIVEDLIVKYIVCAAKNVGEVKETKTEIKAGDFTKKVTQLSAVIDKDSLIDISSEVIKEVENDKETQKIIDEIAENSDFDKNEVNQQIENALGNMVVLFGEKHNGEFTLDLYVDAKGDIIGVNLAGDKFEYTDCTIFKGLKVGITKSFTFDDMNASLNGTAKVESGKGVGYFKISVLGTDVADIEVRDLDIKKYLKGMIDCKAEVDFNESASSIGSLAFGVRGDDNNTERLLKLLPDFSSAIEIKSDSPGEYECKVLLDHKGENFADVRVIKGGDVKEIEVPEDTIDTDDKKYLEKWLKDIDNKLLIERLRKVGAPLKLTYALEAALKLLF